MQHRVQDQSPLLRRKEAYWARYFSWYSLSNDLPIGVRDGGAGGAGGAAAPPKKITKSKSRANVQHKSGEEWEIKKPKSPQFVAQTKAVGQYSLHSRAILAYYKKNWDQLCQFCSKFSDVCKSCLMFRKIL
jgi:hypothetical protein